MSENTACRLFKRCGGCQLKESYREQLAWKQGKVDRMLSKFTKPQRIIGMKNPYNYRNKVQHGFYTNPSRQIISGICQFVLTFQLFTELLIVHTVAFRLTSVGRGIETVDRFFTQAL